MHSVILDTLRLQKTLDSLPLLPPESRNGHNLGTSIRSILAPQEERKTPPRNVDTDLIGPLRKELSTSPTTAHQTYLHA